MAPEAFAGYTLVAKLGQGGMAEVYLALAPGPQGFQKLVVVKRLHTNMEEEPVLVAMFLDEARLAARLAHPNVVQTNDVGEYEGSYFIAMEYLDGQPYDRVLKRSVRDGAALSLPMAARLVADALDGLHYAHEARDYDGTPLGVVHRDISPHNLFVTYDGVVKLLDFGIAKATTQVVETRTGLVKGKFAYMAPEQARSAPADRRADLFAMGVVLWESIAGRRLFKGESDVGTLQQLLGAEVPTLSSVRAEVPSELEHIVARALQREPDDRYPTAAEMRDDLERWLASTGAHIGRAQVAEHMTALFADTIDVQRRLVAHAVEQGQALRAHGTTRTSITPVAMPERHDSTKPMVTPLAVQSAVPPAPPEKRSRTPVILALAAVSLVAVAIGGTSWVLGTGRESSREDAPADRGRVGAPSGDTSARRDTSADGTGAGGETRAAAGRAGRTDAIDDAPDGPTAGLTGAMDAPAGEVGAMDAPAGEVGAGIPDETGISARALAFRRRRLHAGSDVARPAPTPAAPAAPVEPAEAAAPSAPGTLTLDTTPWANVTLNGRSLGATPLIRVSLPPGSHTLVLSNPDEGLTTQYRVTIRSGESVTRRIGLE
jgi:serine/threonine-protein kinase